MIQERMEIRNAVEDGRVEEAVRRVNELDPEVCPALYCLRSSKTSQMKRVPL